jgi:hypothetical protein
VSQVVFLETWEVELMQSFRWTKVRILVGVAVAGALLVLGQDSVHARKPYHDAFVAAYPALADAAKTAKCNVCHYGDAKKNRNDYGEAMVKALAGKKNLKEGDEGIMKALKEIEASKGSEGKAFGELIKAGKLPGKEPAAK